MTNVWKRRTKKKSGNVFGEVEGVASLKRRKRTRMEREESILRRKIFLRKRVRKWRKMLRVWKCLISVREKEQK